MFGTFEIVTNKLDLILTSSLFVQRHWRLVDDQLKPFKIQLTKLKRFDKRYKGERNKLERKRIFFCLLNEVGDTLGTAANLLAGVVELVEASVARNDLKHLGKFFVIWQSCDLYYKHIWS